MTLPAPNSLLSRQTANLLYESVIRCVRSGVSMVLKTVSIQSLVANVSGLVAVGTLSASCLSLGRAIACASFLCRQPPMGAIGSVRQRNLLADLRGGSIGVARVCGVRPSRGVLPGDLTTEQRVASL